MYYNIYNISLFIMVNMFKTNTNKFVFIFI